MSRWRAVLRSLEAAGRFKEDLVLVVVLGGMILLAAAQILLRNAFDISFFWTDELLRLMVLWLTLVGALVASRNDRHLSIAVLDRFLPPRWQVGVKALLHAFTTVICSLIAWHSFRFVYSSYEYGDQMLGGVPAWILQSILPIGFGLMAWRYLLHCVGAAADFADGKSGP